MEDRTGLWGAGDEFWSERPFLLRRYMTTVIVGSAGPPELSINCNNPVLKPLMTACRDTFGYGFLHVVDDTRLEWRWKDIPTQAWQDAFALVRTRS